jgi:hypothetical protein
VRAGSNRRTPLSTVLSKTRGGTHVAILAPLSYASTELVFISMLTNTSKWIKNGA